MINDDCLNELLSYTERDDVGITGARLLYEDNTVQHAGVVIGYNGLAGHTFVGNEPDDVGYRAYVIQARDYSAVTAACLMVKASLYDEVGGFEEELEVAFNDVDFCLKVREKDILSYTILMQCFTTMSQKAVDMRIRLKKGTDLKRKHSLLTISGKDTCRRRSML